jgi:hypothetical protein
MESTLHPTPRGREVVLEQLRIVALNIRPAARVVAIVLGIVTVLISIDVSRGSALTWFDSRDWFPLGLIASIYPFAVWQRDKLFRPAFLWTLPVDRTRLALAKVFAGWVWLMTALAIFIVWQHILVAIAGIAGARTVPLIAFVGTTATYLLGSALVIGMRHPLRLLLGTGGVFFLLATFNEALGRTQAGQSNMFAWSGVLRWAVYGPHGIDTILSSRAFHAIVDRLSPYLIPIWLGAGAIALWASLSRHGELRRH